ncbi:type VII secretion protein EccB [Actinoplanes sp. NPDC023801]|uniref:type VII secretion protein EccB n=1 Tax=Actinoplanes sp. NPDC023801 TaxID=3154595 RepID=UPI0033CB49F7
MISRRDQLQSYQFMNQRVISAFVMRETDPAQSPLRRGIGALFGGLMVAILVAAGFGIYGVLTRTGANQWQRDGSVVVERETGASFVYLRGRLNPALNFASAKLAAGRPNPPVFRIAAKSLAGTPRGVTIGIAGAPASLPEPARQTGLPWAMCAITTDRPASVLVIGASGATGTALGNRGLLVTDNPGAETTHLVWQGRKHRIPERDTSVALFGPNQAPTRISTAWLNALPSGADIVPFDIRDLGDNSSAAPGLDIGDIVFTETGSGRQFNLILDDGRAPVTALQQVVLSAAEGFGEPRKIAVGDLTDIPESRALPAGDLRGPDQVPQLATVARDESACAVTTDAAKPPAVSVGGPADAFDAAIPTSGTAGSGRPLADRIQVPGGRFALVRVPGSGGFTLVTDVGLRHPVPNLDALAALGYNPAIAAEIPTALINSIPAGVTLDPAAAGQPAINTN